jgi:polysaccharide pyruvyl transferase WcaK-like protein
MASKMRAKVIFLPMRIEGSQGEPGQDDDNVCRDIMAVMEYRKKALMIKGDYSPQEIMGIIGQMDMVVSIRMHAIIFAAACGVPFVGLSVYKYKGEGFFHMLGATDRFIYIQETSSEALIRLVESTWARRQEIGKSLGANVANLRKRAISNAKWAFKLLQEKPNALRGKER